MTSSRRILRTSPKVGCSFLRLLARPDNRKNAADDSCKTTPQLPALRYVTGVHLLTTSLSIHKKRRQALTTLCGVPPKTDKLTKPQNYGPPQRINYTFLAFSERCARDKF
ncbi:hypothetical protein BaRGS_00023848 [Batillaria attramentaria]|uniref:Uncharacterized protein n=1 Tax=Batillaria attramentaria TaxID=370345 RepID=A0ABD0KCR3_9CAEN